MHNNYLINWGVYQMKKILLTLFVISLIFPTTISAESLYLYHNIPFALTSSSELEQILTKEFGETNTSDFAAQKNYASSCDEGNTYRVVVVFSAIYNGTEYTVDRTSRSVTYR